MHRISLERIATQLPDLLWLHTPLDGNSTKQVGMAVPFFGFGQNDPFCGYAHSRRGGTLSLISWREFDAPGLRTGERVPVKLIKLQELRTSVKLA